MADPGGVAPDAFDAIDEFVHRLKNGNEEQGDRVVHSAHPLVLLVESMLESVSSANLSKPIVGLSPTSERNLISERRRLEDHDEREELQRLLYSFEPLCRIVRESKYGSGDDEDSPRFFEELFPTWLDRLHAWADDKNFVALMDRLSDAQDVYSEVVYEVVDNDEIDHE